MPDVKTILAIDTATGPCSVAVWKDGKVAAYLEKAGITQSVSLMPMVEEALKIASITYKNISLVAATVGPGSFTGIRVGLAAARGICFAGNLPGIGVSSMDVLAFAGQQLRPQAQAILTIINAGKGEVCYQPYRLLPEWAALAQPKLGKLDEALASLPAPMLVAGNMTVDAPGYETLPITFPRADALAALAAAHGERIGVAMHPFYIRPPDAKPQKIGQ